MKSYFLITENYNSFYGIEYEEGLKKTGFKRVNPERPEKDHYLKLVFIPDEIVFFPLTLPKDLKKDLKYLQIDNEVMQKMEEFALNPERYTYIFREYKNTQNKKMNDVYVYIYPKPSVFFSNEEYFLIDFVVDTVKKSNFNEPHIEIIPLQNYYAEFLFIGKNLKNLRITSKEEISYEKNLLKQIFYEETQIEIDENNIFDLSSEFETFLKKLNIKLKLKNVCDDNIINFFYTIHNKITPLRIEKKISLFIGKKDLKTLNLTLAFIFVALSLAAGYIYITYTHNIKKTEMLNTELQNIQNRLAQLLRKHALITQFEKSRLNKNLKSTEIPVIIEFLYELKNFSKAQNFIIYDINYVKIKKRYYYRLLIQTENIDKIKQFLAQNAFIKDFSIDNVYFVNNKKIAVVLVELKRITYGY